MCTFRIRAIKKKHAKARVGEAFFALIGHEARGIERSWLRRNDDVMDDRNAEAPRQGKTLEACRLLVQYVDGVLRERRRRRKRGRGGGSRWSRSARRAMSDSWNAAEAIPRNYDLRPAAQHHKRFPRFNSLIPLFPVSCPSSFRYLVPRAPAHPTSLFFFRFILPGSQRAVTVGTNAHACSD